MKQHTTNYTNTFIEVADDCPVEMSEIPKGRADNKTIPQIQYEMMTAKPYAYTSDDIFFMVHAIKNDIIEADHETARLEYFSKGRPCFRASPLTKRYGFGIHSDEMSRVALYARESKEYQNFILDTNLNKVKAMRSKKN